jgi:hypothetical protein
MALLLQQFLVSHTLSQRGDSQTEHVRARRPSAFSALKGVGNLFSHIEYWLSKRDVYHQHVYVSPILHNAISRKQLSQQIDTADLLCATPSANVITYVISNVTNF